MKSFSELLKGIKAKLIKFFGKKQKQIIVSNVVTQQTKESIGHFPRYKRKNNRKATAGRIIQAVKMPNGKTRFIMHSK